MSFPRTLKELCTPAYVYFIISMFAIVVIAFQNMYDNKKYKIGKFTCDVPSCAVIFIVKIIYVLFWTWVLNLICKDGHKGIAWFLVLLPFIAFFILIAMVMVYKDINKSKGKH